MTSNTSTHAAAASLPSETRALVLHGPKDFKIETRKLSPPLPNELQIAILRTGLCGSDLHYYSHGRNGNFALREPLSLGHESAGIVTAVGSAVTTFTTGDHVALEVGVACGKCSYCKPSTPTSNGTGRASTSPTAARYNLCTAMQFRSSAKTFPHYQGTLQQRINHPAAWCHLLPPSISLDLGALLEPLGVAIHAARRSHMQGGETALVLGAGAVGLLCAWVARKHRASRIVIADIDAGRVQFAVDKGYADAGIVVPMKRGKDVDEKLEIAQEMARMACEENAAGAEFDVVFECSGVEACVQAAIYATKAGGRVMMVGMGTPVQTLPIAAAALREVDLCGVFRYADTYGEGIEMVKEVEEGLPDLRELVTHRFKGLEGAETAFETAGRGKDEEGKLVLKVVVDME